jgi:acyl transferase domain-containing protein
VSPCHLAAEDDVIMFDNDFFGISETEAAVLNSDGLQ